MSEEKVNEIQMRNLSMSSGGASDSDDSSEEINDEIPRNPCWKWWNAQLNISYGMSTQAVQLRQNMVWAKICELFLELFSWKRKLWFKTFNTELYLTQV